MKDAPGPNRGNSRYKGLEASKGLQTKGVWGAECEGVWRTLEGQQASWLCGEFSYHSRCLRINYLAVASEVRCPAA